VGAAYRRSRLRATSGNRGVKPLLQPPAALQEFHEKILGADAVVNSRKGIMRRLLKFAGYAAKLWGNE
jgi:hypothetical protein